VRRLHIGKNAKKQRKGQKRQLKELKGREEREGRKEGHHSSRPSGALRRGF
jgi:hypothetical protein